ncbi:MAG: alpha-1,4-glucan--maltose-1-phosphate maltosyltransferase [Verrucomicrobiota bacterium]
MIENVSPSIDGGGHAIKRIVGEQLVVEADLFADSYVVLSAVVKYRHTDREEWSEAEMVRMANDRWRAKFTVTSLGVWVYTIEAWVDRFKSWQDELRKKIATGQNLDLELSAGVKLIEEAAGQAGGTSAGRLNQWAKELTAKTAGGKAQTELALDEALGNLVVRHSHRAFATTIDRNLRVIVDPERARFSAWYEMFPRSFSAEAGQHGTFKDCEAQLPRIARMGFDVLYLPPIHPIGRAFRKGRNNDPACQPDDPGSPWAIGAAEGGHKDVHPRLGTRADFRRLVVQARALGIEIALDIALQCSPDHPYLREHPEWFRKRPDGSIAYAENPPKKYQDIYPFDFECADWCALWTELKSIFEFWSGQGVKIFRVDNPHTKSFAFWEWCLATLKREQPELIFLAEAFTRPAVMNHLAKIGFSQSYNYFPWRNSKQELATYLSELTRPPTIDYFRANLWPNTPDILPEYLQTGSRAAFEIRLILAATLGASYGIYGPAFELFEGRALKPGTEEYLDSEKYEIRRWNLQAPGNLTDLITRVNRIRRENPALQFDRNLKFHPVENENLLAYTKSAHDGAEVVLVVANLDPYHTQSGWVEFAADEFQDQPGRFYQMHDLLTGARFIWHGRRNYIELDPNYSPAHIFRVRRHVRTERDFDYFM